MVGGDVETGSNAGYPPSVAGSSTAPQASNVYILDTSSPNNIPVLPPNPVDPSKINIREMNKKFARGEHEFGKFLESRDLLGPLRVAIFDSIVCILNLLNFFLNKFISMNTYVCLCIVKIT